MITIATALSLDPTFIMSAVLSLVLLPVGARISNDLARPAWLVVAKGNKWLLDTVSKGYAWSWKYFPPSKSRIVRSRDNLDEGSLKVLDDERDDAIRAGALFPVSESTVDDQTTVVSGYFAVPKAQPGQWRPIIDLRYLNKFIGKKTFKMTRVADVAEHTEETLAVLAHLLERSLLRVQNLVFWTHLRSEDLHADYKGFLFFLRSVW